MKNVHKIFQKSKFVFQKAKMCSMVPVYAFVYFVSIKIIARNYYFSAGDGPYILCTFSQNVYNEPVCSNFIFRNINAIFKNKGNYIHLSQIFSFFILRNNFHTVQFTQLVFNAVRFDSCVQSCHYHNNQVLGQFHHPSQMPSCSTPALANTSFCPYSLTFPEYHINEII